MFGTVAEAMAATGADVSVIFVPAGRHQGRRHRGDRRADPAGHRDHRGRPGARHAPSSGRTPAPTGNATRIVGPNCPGVASPGKSNAGIIPADITTEGRIGLVSKSGTLTYQMMYELRDIGFSTAVGIGGDPIIGTTHIDCLQAFQDDPETDAIVMIGEIGGDAEERAAAFIEQQRDQAGRRLRRRASPRPRARRWATRARSSRARPAPPQAKKEALEKVGVRVGTTPSETAAPGPRAHAVASARLAALRRAVAAPCGASATRRRRPARLRRPRRAYRQADAVTAQPSAPAPRRARGRHPGPRPARLAARLRRAPGPWRPGAVAAGRARRDRPARAASAGSRRRTTASGLPACCARPRLLWLVGHHVGFALRGAGRIGMLPLGLVAAARRPALAGRPLGGPRQRRCQRLRQVGLRGGGAGRALRAARRRARRWPAGPR